MDSNFKLTVLEKVRKTPAEPTPEEKLIDDIREICRRIDTAYARFEYEEDADLVEAAIYELEALKARYRYLLRIAKERDLHGAAIKPYGAQTEGWIRWDRPDGYSLCGRNCGGARDSRRNAALRPCA